MKTYKKIVEQELSRLVITYDEVDSPRVNNTNLGYFITCNRKYNSPDTNNTLQYIIEQAGDQASSQEEHMNIIRQRVADELDEVITDIFPICRHEHGNVVYRRGTTHGFDYSNDGFYIVTNKTHEEYGKHGKPIEAIIDGEIEEYTAWVNGEVYGYILYDEEGNEVESQGGFYSLEDIKDNLPEIWKDENLLDYLKY